MWASDFKQTDMKRIQLFTVILVSLLLIALAFFFHHQLMLYSIQQFTTISFQSTTMGPAGSPLTLMLAAALIPLLYFVANRLVGIRNRGQAFLFIGLMVGFGILGWWLRLQYFKGLIMGYYTSPGIDNTVGVVKLQVERYCLVGVVVGAAIGMVLLMLLNRKSGGIRP